MQRQFGQFSEDSFVRAFRKAISSCKFAKTNESDRTLIALSGGADSSALLLASLAVKQDNTSFHVCHINYCLRGLESEQDEAFCRTLCESQGVPITVHRIEKLESSSELVLRNLRYEFLKKTAEIENCRICLTGHTLDDQIETLLFRLFRGTGPSGLVGINCCRKLTENILLVRPLLNLRHSDCLDFLARLDIQARNDSSNNLSNYSRNFIRNEIIPLINKRFPGFIERLENLRKIVEADDELLSSLSKEAYLDLINSNNTQIHVLKLDDFSELPLSLRRRVLKESFEAHDIYSEFNKIEQILAIIESGAESNISLNDTWDIKLEKNSIKWLDKKNRLLLNDPSDPFLQFLQCAGIFSKEELPLPEPVELNVPGTTLIPKFGLLVKIEELPKSFSLQKFPPAQAYEFYADLSKIGTVYMRLRQPGDHIQPLGMDCNVRLKKYLHTHKSPEILNFAGRAIVLADTCDVIWVPGCGISQKVAVSQRPTHRIKLSRLKDDYVGIC